jgi:2-iminobutanoate/2-iminopropanoate deaminase
VTPCKAMLTIDGLHWKYRRPVDCELILCCLRMLSNSDEYATSFHTRPTWRVKDFLNSEHHMKSASERRTKSNSERQTNAQIVSPAILPPTSFYSHAIEVQTQSRLVFVSGQIPVAPDGSCAKDFATQARQCWRNISAVLAEAGMGLSDVVKIQAFVTRSSDLEAYRSIRNEMVGANRPAHTLLVVAGLGRPEWLVELEAVAAKA